MTSSVVQVVAAIAMFVIFIKFRSKSALLLGVYSLLLAIIPNEYSQSYSVIGITVFIVLTILLFIEPLIENFAKKRKSNSKG